MQTSQGRILLKNISSEPAVTPKIAGKPIKVLLIDRNYEEANITRKMLAEAGGDTFALEYTDRLSIGLERIAKGDINVLVLAPSISDIQRFDSLARWRAQAMGVPIVVLSALSDEKSESVALKKGAQEFLSKDRMDGNLLVRSISRAIARQQFESEMEREVRRLESNEARLSSIIRSNPDGIIIIDQRGIVHFVNPAAEFLFGCKAEQLLGKSFGFFSTIKGEKSELEITRGGGEKVVAEIRVADTKYQGKAAYLASLRDITERKQAEEAAKSARETAETRATKAHKSAEAAKKAARETVARAKEEVILILEDAEVTKKTAEEVTAKAREDAEVARKAAEETVAQAREEAETRVTKATKSAEAIKKTARETIVKAEDAARLAKEEAKTARKTAEEAIAKAEDTARLAKEDAKVARRTAEEAVAKARDAARLAKEDTEATRKTAEEAVAQAREEARMARENAEVAVKAAEEAVAQAREDARLAKEDTGIAGKNSWEVTAKDDETTRLARDEAETARKTAEEAIAQAREEARIARDEAEAVRKTAEEAVAQAKEETRLAKEDTGTAGKNSWEVTAKAEGEIQKLDPMQSEFMSNIVHELRAPLHSILAFTKLLLEGKVPEPETQHEFLTIIADQSTHLRKLLDDLVEIPPVASGVFKIRKEHVSMKDLLQNTTQELYSVANQKNILLSEDIPPTLPAMEVDSQRLRQVMFNLLGNAIKFSNDGDCINVKAEVKNSSLLVQVADQGIGITEEAMPYLFDKYYQVKNTTRVGGLGLGLYISKQIIEAHGGQIWADSTEGVGSTFSFTLPLDKVYR